MQTEPEIDYINCKPSDTLQAHVAKGIEMLEKRFGRIVDCRVAVRGPGAHHQTGGLFEIAIHLGLPNGKHVDIKRTPSADERLSDPVFAIDDAFKRARRKLQDQARRLQGKVKVHETSPMGSVRSVFLEEGYGFIDADDGREIYFHRNSVAENGFAKLAAGDRVSFSEARGDKGPQASMVKSERYR